MSGHAAEFTKIYAAYRPGIVRYLAGLVGQPEAEDLAQEVFAKVFRSLPAFRGDSSLATWLYRIARNAAFDRLRIASSRTTRLGAEPGRFGEIPDPGESAAGEGTSAERALIRREMNECIRGLMEEIPERYRAVLALSDMEELSNREIAERLGLSLETVKIRLHRSRAMLRARMDGHCRLYRDERNELACEEKAGR